MLIYTKHIKINSPLVFFKWLLFYCVVFNSSLKSQTPAPISANSEYKIKSVFLFNFTRFVEWPPSSFKSSDAPFVIGVCGRNPFSHYLEETVYGEKVGTHPIVVKYYSDLNSVNDCHILFINTNELTRVKDFINREESMPVLTVSDLPEFNEVGGVVRFYNDKNRVRFQINADEAKRRNLSVSSRLLNLSK